MVIACYSHIVYSTMHPSYAQQVRYHLHVGTRCLVGATLPQTFSVSSGQSEGSKSMNIRVLLATFPSTHFNTTGVSSASNPVPLGTVGLHRPTPYTIAVSICWRRLVHCFRRMFEWPFLGIPLDASAREPCQETRRDDTSIYRRQLAATSSPTNSNHAPTHP